MADLIHPRLLASLQNFYPSSGTVQQATMTQDSVGEPIPAWADFLTDIDCRVSPTGGSEERLPGQTYSIGSHAANLAGYYPTIEVAMRFVVDSVNYDILAVEHDGNGSSTRLSMELVQ